MAHGDASATAEKLKSQITDVRRATLRYHDVRAAEEDPYAKFPDLNGDCVAQPGQGAMGIHYLNGGLIDDGAVRPSVPPGARTNRYNVPAFYELHLWVWEHNGNGIFNDWNPAVRCP